MLPFYSSLVKNNTLPTHVKFHLNIETAVTECRLTSTYPQHAMMKGRVNIYARFEASNCLWLFYIIIGD